MDETNGDDSMDYENCDGDDIRNIKETNMSPKNEKQQIPRQLLNVRAKKHKKCILYLTTWLMCVIVIRTLKPLPRNEMVIIIA